MPHNNTSTSTMPQPQEHVFPLSDARIIRPTPTTAAPSAVLATHFRGTAPLSVPFTALPQGPPVIHRGAAPTAMPIPGSTIYTVYVPAGTHPHHHALPAHQLHPLHHAAAPMTAPPTTAAHLTPSVHMVPSMAHAEDASSLSPTAVVTTVPLSSSCNSSTVTPKVYATPEHSNVASSDDETAATTKQTNRSTAGSFDSQHAAAHSVMLLASGRTLSKEKRKAPQSPSSDGEADEELETGSPSGNGAPTTESTKVPFKKRKMVSEIWLRTKQHAPQEDGEHSSYHVSPVSHGSKTAGANTWSPDRSHASHGSSYADDQLKGGQALPETAKITEGKTIAGIATAPPKTVTTVRHFPSQLYDLLDAASAEDEGVLQWCSNGKAWRIVRWDALRKSVLPKHFGGASVDTFLSEISAWGFTEVSNGNDAGAYVHTVSSIMAMNWWCKRA